MFRTMAGSTSPGTRRGVVGLVGSRNVFSRAFRCAREDRAHPRLPQRRSAGARHCRSEPDRPCVDGQWSRLANDHVEPVGVVFRLIFANRRKFATSLQKQEFAEPLRALLGVRFAVCSEQAPGSRTRHPRPVRWQKRISRRCRRRCSGDLRSRPAGSSSKKNRPCVRRIGRRSLWSRSFSIRTSGEGTLGGPGTQTPLGAVFVRSWRGPCS